MQTGKEVSSAALLEILAPTLREPAPSKADDDGVATAVSGRPDCDVMVQSAARKSCLYCTYRLEIQYCGQKRDGAMLK